MGHKFGIFYRVAHIGYTAIGAGFARVRTLPIFWNPTWTNQILWDEPADGMNPLVGSTSRMNPRIKGSCGSDETVDRMHSLAGWIRGSMELASRVEWFSWSDEPAGRVNLRVGSRGVDSWLVIRLESRLESHFCDSWLVMTRITDL